MGTVNNSFLLDGIAVAGMSLLGNQAMSICNQRLFTDIQLGFVVGLSLVGGVALDYAFKDNKYQKLFRMCGIENKDKQVPVIIKNDKKRNELVLHMPPGISQKKFEEKQQELEQNLNCKIEYGFNKNLIMKLIKMNLKNKYDYEFEQCKDPTKLFIGYTNEGKFYFDIDKATQTIVAGEPNSGKSSMLRTIILSLLLNKHNIDLHLIDFQDVELGIFQDCKKVKSYGKTPEDFSRLLDQMEEESERRLKLFTSVRSKTYIQKLAVWNKYYPERALPFKVCIIDEFARLAEDEYKAVLERFRTRVAMDRKVGILYIASMQRPDVKVISGSIKGNMPTRIAFKTVTATDSEVILDISGAEKIKNQGRCLMKYLGELKEVQCLYIEPEDVRAILKQHNAYKTKKDIAEERKQQISDFHQKFQNPYAKGGAKVDNKA